MNPTTFFRPSAATTAFASIIGIAYAQTGTTGSDRTNPDATGTMNRDSTGTMNRDSTGTMNRDSTNATNRDSTDNVNRSSPRDRSNERLARADRN